MSRRVGGMLQPLPPRPKKNARRPFLRTLEPHGYIIRAPWRDGPWSGHDGISVTPFVKALRPLIDAGCQYTNDEITAQLRRVEESAPHPFGPVFVASPLDDGHRDVWRHELAVALGDAVLSMDGDVRDP